MEIIDGQMHLDQAEVNATGYSTPLDVGIFAGGLRDAVRYNLALRTAQNEGRAAIDPPWTPAMVKAHIVALKGLEAKLCDLLPPAPPHPASD